MTRPIRPTSNPTPSRPEFIPDGWVFLYDAVQILGNVMHGEDWTEHDSAARNARQIKEEKDRVERFKVVARNRARAPRVHMVGGQGEWPRGVPVSARRVERPKLFDDDESEIAASRRGQEVRSRLRQWLYAHQESAVCLSVDGKNRDIDNSIWASAAADRILQSGWVTINKNSGWVLVQRTYFDLMASLPASMSGEPNDADQGAADEPPAQSEGAEATVEQIHIGNLSFAREPKKALKDWLGQKGLSGGADHKHDYLDLNRRLDGFQSKFGDEYLFKKLGSIASIAKTLRANLEEDGAQVPVDSVLRDFVTAWAHDKALSAKSAVK